MAKLVKYGIYNPRLKMWFSQISREGRTVWETSAKRTKTYDTHGIALIRCGELFTAWGERGLEVKEVPNG